VIVLVVVGMSGVLVSNSGGSVATNTTDLSSRSGSTSGGVAIVESATDSSGNGLVKLSNFTGEGFSLTKVSVVTPTGTLVDNNFDSVYIDSSGGITFSLKDLGDACECVTGENNKSCTFVVEYTSSNGLAKSQTITTNVDCVSAISSSEAIIGPADFVGPIVLITNPESDSTANTSEVDFEYSPTDNNAVKKCSLLIDDVVEDTDTSSPFDLFAYTFSSNGDYDYEIECEDYSNNTGSNSGVITIDFDETNPSVTLAGPIDEYSTRDELVDFNFYASDNNALHQCVLTIDGDDVNTISTVTNNAYNTISHTFSSFGDYTWDVNCLDYSSNSTTSGAPRMVTYSRPLEFSTSWAKNPAIGSTSCTDLATTVAVDSNGNVYVGGYDWCTVLAFGNDVNLYNKGHYDFFVVKYNSSGVAQWAQGPASGSGSSAEFGWAIAVDSNGNVYFAGDSSSPTLSFGNDVNLTNRGGQDFFVVKYNSSGVAQWAKNPASGGGTGDDTAKAVAVDSNGNVYVGGNSGMGNFLGFGNDVNTTNTGSSNFFVVKYDSSGAPQWVKFPTSAGESYSYSVAVDSNGNVYTTGYFNGSDLGLGGGVTVTRRNWSYDFYVVKYNSSGVVQWGQGPAVGTGASTEYGYGVTVDSNWNVYVAGYFESAILGFSSDVNLTNRGSYDIFVVKYNSSGVAQWARGPASGSGTGSESANSVAVDPSGNVYLGCYSNSALVDFGNDKNLTNRGNIDFVVVKYDSNGVAQWAQGPASGSGASNESGYSVAVDSSGRAYTAGYFSSTTLGFGNDVNLTNRGSNDFFVVKYDYS